MQTFDKLWKGIIEDLFEDFLFFFYPEAIELFDLKKGYAFLDQELDQLFPETALNNRYVDKLVKVYLLDGQEEWILIHIEVQGYEDPDFAARMYTYYYRIRDRYQKEISALAIFTDKKIGYEPAEYRRQYLGTEIIYRYKTYKVLAQSSDSLEKSNNPFAIVILVALTALKKGNQDDEHLMKIKLDLVKMLYARNFSKERIRYIVKFIEYYIRFEKQENNLTFENIIVSIYDPTRKNMGIEEILLMDARQEGLEKGIEKGIEKGKLEEKEELVIKAHLKGKSNEFIADLFDMPVEEVAAIIAKYYQQKEKL